MLQNIQFQIDFWFDMDFASYHLFNIHLYHVNIMETDNEENEDVKIK